MELLWYKFGTDYKKHKTPMLPNFWAAPEQYEHSNWKQEQCLAATNAAGHQGGLISLYNGVQGVASINIHPQY